MNKISFSFSFGKKKFESHLQDNKKKFDERNSK